PSTTSGSPIISAPPPPRTRYTRIEGQRDERRAARTHPALHPERPPGPAGPHRGRVRLGHAAGAQAPEHAAGGARRAGLRPAADLGRAGRPAGRAARRAPTLSGAGAALAASRALPGSGGAAAAADHRPDHPLGDDELPPARRPVRHAAGAAAGPGRSGSGRPRGTRVEALLRLVREAGRAPAGRARGPRRGFLPVLPRPLLVHALAASRRRALR